MTLDITDEERDYLLEILDARREELIHELHHTDTLDFKEMLKRKVELVEGIGSKLATAARPASKTSTSPTAPPATASCTRPPSANSSPKSSSTAAHTRLTHTPSAPRASPRASRTPRRSFSDSNFQTGV